MKMLASWLPLAMWCFAKKILSKSCGCWWPTIYQNGAKAFLNYHLYYFILLNFTTYSEININFILYQNLKFRKTINVFRYLNFKSDCRKDLTQKIQNFKNALKDAKYWEKLQTLPLGGRQGIRFSIVIKKLQTFF